MARLYADENFPLPAIAHLRQLGHDVITVQDTGRAGEGVPDFEVLREATRLGRVVLTLNRRHFLRLHSGDAGHAGMILCTFDPDFEAQAERIHRAVGLHPDIEGTVIRVNRPPPAEKVESDPGPKPDR